MKNVLLAAVVALLTAAPLAAFEGEKIDKETKERIVKRVSALLEEHNAKVRAEVEKIVKEELAKVKTEKPVATTAGKPYLGIRVEILDNGEGIKITEVVEGGPAAKAGLKSDDVIVEVDGKKIDEDAFAERIKNAKPGDVVKIGFKRGDEKKDLDVTLGKKTE